MSRVTQRPRMDRSAGHVRVYLAEADQLVAHLRRHDHHDLADDVGALIEDAHDDPRGLYAIDLRGAGHHHGLLRAAINLVRGIKVAPSTLVLRARPGASR